MQIKKMIPGCNFALEG